MQVKLPALGEGATSGTVSGIMVKVGDEVTEGQPLIELESEKAVASIPAPASGKVTEVLVKEGDEISVGQAIVTLDGGAQEGKGKPTPPAPKKEQSPSQEELRVSIAPSGELVQDETPSGEPVHEPPPGFPPPAAPSVRFVARSMGIDLRYVRGSQRGGRIVMNDLRAYIEALKNRPQARAAVTTAEPAPSPAPDFSRWGSVSRKKLSKLRSAISRKMVESWTRVPHVTQFDNADITDLLRKKKIHSPFYKKKGVSLTITPFVMRALVDVLKQYPLFNASLDEAAGEIVHKDYYHFGIAVDTEHGLLVPVIRDVDRKSIFELSQELVAVAGRARERSITLEEMQGGTFTISNQGGIGGSHFTPIINTPEVAILGIGRGQEQAVFRTQRAEKRTLLPLALSYDHRVIDGADAARFMVALNERLGNFKESELRVNQP